MLLSQEVKEILKITDYLFLNDREFKLLGRYTPGIRDEKIAEKIFDICSPSARLIVLEQYRFVKSFCRLHNRMLSFNYPVENLPQVIIEDATGAGDVFVAGFLSTKLLLGMEFSHGINFGLRLVKSKLRAAGTGNFSKFPDIFCSLVDESSSQPMGSSANLIEEDKVPSKSKERKEKVIAFISASFDDEVDNIITWFIDIIKSLDIEVIWLKELYQSRQVIDKIKENLKDCNCFIQIITKNVMEEGKEAGWIGNEIAWANDSTPNGNMVIFVEKGTKATGLARQITDHVEFDPNNLHESVPRIIRFLVDLKRRLLL